MGRAFAKDSQRLSKDVRNSTAGVSGKLQRTQGDAHGRGNPDGGGSADGEILDRRDDVAPVRQGQVADLSRKGLLVDEDDGVVGPENGSDHDPDSIFLSRSLTSCGLALPLVSLHHLADEEGKELVLACPVLGELRRVFRHGLLDGLYDGPLVGDLGEALLLDDVGGLLRGLVHLLEDFLGDLAADGPVLDEADHLGQVVGGDGAFPDVALLLVEIAQQIAHDPVADDLGLAAELHRLFIIVGQGPAGRQHARIVGGDAVLPDEAVLLRQRELGQRLADLLDPLVDDQTGTRSGSGK